MYSSKKSREFILLSTFEASSILIGCVPPAPANRSWCQPGRGGVVKTRDPAGVATALQRQGEGWGRGGRSQIFLSPWVTYDLPSRFTCPQELAMNTVKAMWSFTCSKFRGSYKPPAIQIRVTVLTFAYKFKFTNGNGDIHYLFSCWDSAIEPCGYPTASGLGDSVEAKLRNSSESLNPCMYWWYLQRNN
jgi:hypothetical protein